MTTVAGRYEIEREIGRGGMGIVYLARDTKLGRRVALKKLAKGSGLVEDDEARKRMMREARLTSRLSNPAIVTLHDAVEENDDLYLVLEYYPYPSLADRVRDEGPLDVEETRSVGSQVFSALAAAHAQGIIHRDVKPDNVLMGEDGAKLTDFGIARVAEDLTETGTRITRTGFMVGTPGYMSPEQLKNEPTTESTDTFAAGLVLYFCLTGDEPYAGSDPASIAYRVVHEPLDFEGVEAPDWMRGTIEAATSKDPGRRPSAADLAEAFESRAEPASRAEGDTDRTVVAGAAAAGVAGAAVAAAAMAQEADAEEVPAGAAAGGTTPPTAQEFPAEAVGGGGPAGPGGPGGGGGYTGGSASPAGETNWWRDRWPLVAGAAIVVLIVLVAAVFVVRGASGSDEVLLETAASTGPDPFTPPVSPEVTPPPAGTAGTGSTAGGATAAGPYGGTGDNSTCDVDLLISFLTDPANAAQARAWAEIRGIPVSEIETYLRTLTPTVLTADIRVTNHGFANGSAYSRQSVLQAGTAVLVDAYGEPVVRCRCGNPLLPPRKTKDPTYVGNPWPGFDSTVVVVVVVVEEEIFPTTSGPGDTRPTTTTTSGATTTTAPTPGSGDEAVAIVRSALEECAAQVGGTLDPISYDPSPTSDPVVFRVRVTSQEGEFATWDVDTLAGTLTPVEGLAADLNGFCPNF